MAIRETLRTFEAKEQESPLSDEARKALGAKLDVVVEQALAGESRELTDADWGDILAGRYKHPLDAGSLAVPPGWKPKKQAR